MNLGFVFREAIKGRGRNITMTIAMVITTAISVALVVAGILVTQMTNDTKDIYLEQVEVMVQLNEQISADDPECQDPACADLQKKLESDDAIESVTYRNRAESYERFVELFRESDPVLVEETSRDSMPAALHVRLQDPTDTSPIDAVRDLPQVAYVADQASDVRGLADSMDSFRNATFIIAAAQALAAIFLISNMVQLAAYNRREQIGIMRMVGASRWFTQAPFVLEAVLSVLIGAVLATVGVWAGKQLIVDPLLGDLYANQLIARVPDSTVWAVMPLVGLVAMVLGGLAAQVALRSYVRK